MAQLQNNRNTIAERQSPRTRRYSANMEDYLEAIRILSESVSPVTITQLSDSLNVSKPSVTAAMAKLAAAGLVQHEKYGAVDLTARGKSVADDVCHRHDALKVFLVDILGVSPATAEEDACKLEHHLSHDSAMRLTRFITYVLNDARGRPGWLEEFANRDDSQLTVGDVHTTPGRTASLP